MCVATLVFPSYLKKIKVKKEVIVLLQKKNIKQKKKQQELTMWRTHTDNPILCSKQCKTECLNKVVKLKKQRKKQAGKVGVGKQADKREVSGLTNCVEFIVFL